MALIATVKVMAETPWPYTKITRPLFYAGVLLAAANVIDVLDWRWSLAMVAFLAVAGVAGVVVGTVMRTEAVPVAVYALAVALTSSVFMVWSTWTGLYHPGPIVVFLVGLLVLWPLYGVVVTTAAEADEQHTTTQEAKLNPTTADRTMWEQIMDTHGKPGMQELEQREHRAGYSVIMQHEKGKLTAESFETSLGAIEGVASKIVAEANRESRKEVHVPFRKSMLTVRQGDAPHEVEITVDTKDILKETVPYDMTDRGPQSIYDHKLAAYKLNGEPVFQFIPEKNELIAGVMGSGKSVYLNKLIADVSACEDALVFVSACAKGSHLVGPWLREWLKDDGVGRPAIDWPATTIEESIRLFQWQYYVLSQRENAPRGGKSKLRCSAKRPFFFTIVEEAPTLLAENPMIKTHKADKPQMSFIDMLVEILRLYRSEGGALAFATQDGGLQFMNAGSLLALLEKKVGFKTANSQGTMNLFCRFPDGVDLSTFVWPGSVYMEDVESGERFKGKVPYIDEVVDVPVLSRRHWSWMPVPEASLQTELYTERFSEERFGALRDKLLTFLADEDSEQPETVAVPFAGGIVDSGAQPVMSVPHGLVPQLNPEWAAALAAHEEEAAEADPEMDQFHLDIEKYLADNASDQQDPAEIDFKGLKEGPGKLILQILVDAGPAGLARKQIIEGSGIPTSTVAAYLKVLEASGLVVSPSRGAYRAARFG